ncbi:transcription-repair coupling factor [Candidatus Gracilibacteria bacterium]|nr:transcription-repair coupling factor [Candidatus Gracilibacteria bacterium]MCF7819685.1 transcription-repair coupling factor [Candidatus Gracilibacteria bacterium]
MTAFCQPTRLPFDLDLSEQIALLEKEKKLTLVNLGNTAAKSFVIAQILEKTPFKNIFWASTDEKADQIFSSAELFFQGHVHLVPEKMSLGQFYQLRDLLENSENSLFLFEDLEAVQKQHFPSQEDIDAEKKILRTGEKIQIYELFEFLQSKGYRSAEDQILQSGEFVRRGETFFVYPENHACCYRILLNGTNIEYIESFPQVEQKMCSIKKVDSLEIFPVEFEHQPEGQFVDLIEQAKETLFISDDLDNDICPKGDFYTITFTTFPQEKETFFHLNFFSVLPFYTIQDFVVDIKERLRREFEVIIMTKKYEEIEKVFRENEVMFTKDLGEKLPSTVKIIALSSDAFLPHSFQNNDRKIAFLTDREIFQFHRSSRQRKAISGVNLDLMTSLKPGDYAIHVDHGLGQFDGIVRRDLGKEFGTREYLKICYAENDKLFVPVESAEKVTKFIGDEDPRLMRLGSSDWAHTQKKLKAEAERIAKDLLKLYASREMSRGKKFAEDDEMIKDFCEAFPYELTPGQERAWDDVRRDMESSQPMDRLVCGDVGFGKTEIAMRAAFKCFRSGLQAAILAPITILAEQHYQTFQKRIEGKNYGIKVALLSRFQSSVEQKKILKDIKLGLVDIVIGTHRLLSDDIEFKNLGLLVIDEEQRFGVKQKEKLKKLRASMDILTMTATPIPRTLNMSLNKLKDISTITTPPPGRLPVVTEVRKYNLNLIRERILFELKRKGQVYFLHNRVQTIEAQAEQLRSLIPEARFIVAHGQLSSTELEERIRRFKKGEADILIASTIIENGIDLPNANTLIVNRAEKFGLSQLYQLRGRVGRRRIQAYAYFLYHGQKLELEAKKRLRAIVEASELGSGFQIAMRDLEIRGAGEILGVSQSGAIKTVGVSHFMRLLHKTIEEMKSGEVATDITEEENITVEIPLSAYIPSSFIPRSDEKIQVYKELASAENIQQLDELRYELREDYGSLPREVENLCRVLALKMHLREANLSGVKVYQSSHKAYEIVLRMGQEFSPDQVFGLVQNSKQKWTITANALKLSLSTLPVTWYEDLVRDVQLLQPKKKEKKG